VGVLGPIELGLVDIAVAVADRGSKFFIRDTESFSKREDLGSELLDDHLVSLLQVRIGVSFVEVAGSEALLAIGGELIESEDLGEQDQLGLDVGVLEFVSLDGVQVDLEHRVLQMLLRHVVDLLSEDLVQLGFERLLRFFDGCSCRGDQERCFDSKCLLENIHVHEIFRSLGFAPSLAQLCELVQVPEGLLQGFTLLSTLDLLHQEAGALLQHDRVVSLEGRHWRVE